MNRLWIGIGLLVILLGMGLGLLWGSHVFFTEFSENVEQAGHLAMSGNWQAAGQKVAKSKAQWDRFHNFWSAFTDHEPMEQMENLFAQLELYQSQQMEIDFSAVCRSLSHMARAIQESHGVKWWSIL